MYKIDFNSPKYLSGVNKITQPRTQVSRLNSSQERVTCSTAGWKLSVYMLLVQEQFGPLLQWILKQQSCHEPQMAAECGLASFKSVFETGGQALFGYRTNVPTPPLYWNATGPHSHRGMVITAHLWHAWLCCPDVCTLFFPVQSMWSRKGGSYAWYWFSPSLCRLYSIAKQAKELSQQLMTVSLGEKGNWKAICAWGRRHKLLKLLQVSHTQHVSSSTGSPFMRFLPCQSLWQKFIYPFVPATFWSTNTFKDCLPGTMPLKQHL